MRTLARIVSIIGVVALSSCNQRTDVDTMLENSETRTEIFESVANNHKFMTEFMKDIQSSDHAIQMMMGNKMMMGNMMKGQGMQVMMKDSMIIKNMMQGMMKDGKMMSNMMQMMHKKGMMSDDCMESCKNMMNKQGLDIIEQGELELSKSQSHGDHH